MIEVQSLPRRTYEDDHWLCLIGRLSDLPEALSAAKLMLESVPASAAENVYGVEYDTLVGVRTKLKTETLDDGKKVQIRAAFECPNRAFSDALVARIQVEWNVGNGVEGRPFVGRVHSESSADRVLSPEWNGLL